MTDASIAYGIDFQRSDMQAAPAFTTVGEILNVSPPSLSRDTVDATHSKSPNRFREFIAGLRDGGEVSVEIQFDPGSTTAAAAIADLETDTAIDYKIVFPDTSEWDFSALCTGIETDAPIDDKMVATFTYKVTGRPVLTAA
ncbi:hypothetical protein KUW09_04855 [Mameliella alba]|nr:hypothetical protein [Antarctobacter heliothermus]MBY6143358.1 hypothetical protein [Mameliella alba]MBY6163969.1 hypothetical protein [Mameliella alba]MBY6172441.1 hypothetical protein [Mameliella alba]MBY6177455.1 hypothetical protein [Mameliella alba]